MDKKINVLFVTNCQGELLSRWLSNDYSEQLTTNLVRTDSNAQVPLHGSPDIIICNNIKSPKRHKSVNELRKLFPSARIIVYEFWRFNGYWPHRLQKKVNWPWYDKSWDKYTCYKSWLNQIISPDIIKSNYIDSVDKLKKMEMVSDIKALDYIMDNHKNIQLFRDEWHPTLELFEYLYSQIIAEIGLGSMITKPRDVDVITPRYTPILNQVSRVLGLKFDDNQVWARSIDLHNKEIKKITPGTPDLITTPRQFYEWIHLQKRKPVK